MSLACAKIWSSYLFPFCHCLLILWIDSCYTEHKILGLMPEAFLPSSTVVVNFWKYLARVIWNFDWWCTSWIFSTMQQFRNKRAFVSLFKWYAFKDGYVITFKCHLTVFPSLKAFWVVGGWWDSVIWKE